MNRPRVALSLELDWLYRRHMDVFVGTQNYAQERDGWECVVDEHVQVALTRGARGGEKAYDGIIARATPELAQSATRCGVPLINVWYNSPCEEVVSVLPDYRLAGEMAAKHLIQRGIRRFACLSARRDRSHRAMLEGFHQVIEEAGHRCICARAGVEPARSPSAWQIFQDTLDAWIAQWRSPVGVLVAYADVSSRHVASACQRHELKIPDEVAVIAGFNESAVCHLPEPSLTGIEFRYEAIGYEAARLLDEMMGGKAAPKKPILLAPRGVVGRQSTDFHVHQDSVVADALRFITAECRHAIDVQDVADAARTSRRTLERRFQAQFGRSVFAEIRRLRIEHAKRLLVDTDESIKRVSFQAGFSSSAQMCQVFRRFVGCSPGEYREGQRRS